VGEGETGGRGGDQEGGERVGKRREGEREESNPWAPGVGVRLR
jgi:hypothetical protein